MARECEAFFDWSGEYASVNTNFFYDAKKTLDLEYVAAFCNSNLFMFLYNQFFGALRMSGGYYQFQSPQLRVIPLRDAPDVSKRHIKKLVDSMVQDDRSTSEQRTKIMADIDRELYKLYDLSPDEIRTIEEEV
jgi:hypothetical protein